MPIKRSDFLSATNRSRWIYPFIQQARLAQIDTGDNLNVGEGLINSTLHWLEQDFATRKDQSFTGALSFTAAVKRQMRVLTNQEAKLVHSAVCLFGFNQYIKHREEDPRGDKHSFYRSLERQNAMPLEKRSWPFLAGLLGLASLKPWL